MSIYKTILIILFINFIVFTGLKIRNAVADEYSPEVNLKWKVIRGVYNDASGIIEVSLGESGEIIAASVMFDTISEFHAFDFGFPTYPTSSKAYDVVFDDSTDTILIRYISSDFDGRDYRILVFYK